MHLNKFEFDLEDQQLQSREVIHGFVLSKASSFCLYKLLDEIYVKLICFVKSGTGYDNIMRLVRGTKSK